MKKTIVLIISAILILLAVPVAFIIIGFGLPAQYGKTYYAELGQMYDRVKNTEGKRIIVVGGSAVAFGLRSDLVEKEIRDYAVCPFGLYGAIGTKAMIDLSKVGIREGDLILLAPEQGSQSLSMYFSGEIMWRAADSNMSMLRHIGGDNRSSMVGSFIGYSAKKFEYWKNDTAPSPSDVYSIDSFDENCMMIYERDHNIMPSRYDSNDSVSYNESILSLDFANYVNEYNKYVKDKGATLLYAFTPVNALSISRDTNVEIVDYFYNYLSETLDCEILGDPNNYIMDYDWFYDSNVHCNSAGAVVYTRKLVNDIKAYLEITEPTTIDIPEKPIVPDESGVDGNNEDAGCFNYEAAAGGVRVTGLSAAAIGKTSLTVPMSINGKAVVSFSASVFVDNRTIENVYLQNNIRTIEDGSFSGCIAMKRLYLLHDSAARCTVNRGLLDGASFKVYVPSALVSEYATSYFWSNYGHIIVGFY